MQDGPGDLTWKEAHHRLIPLMRADNATNMGYIAADYLGLIATLAACAALYSSWAAGTLPTAAFLPLAALGIVAVATIQHRFSGLGHEAGHYVLFRNKVANELVSDVLLMFPLMAMTQRFRSTHLGHHRFVNDPVKDPDFARLHHRPDDHFPMSKRDFWLRYVAESLWLPSLLQYIWGQAKNANVTAGQPEMKGVYRFRLGRCLRGTFWLTTLAAVHVTGSWPIFWIFWVLPLLTAYPFLMQLREIAHHSNAPDAGDFTNSRVFRVNPILREMVFPYGQAFHVTHHLFAMLPHYNIERAHEILMQYPPYREQVVECRGYFFRPLSGASGPTVLDVLSAERPSAVAEGPLPA